MLRWLTFLLALTTCLAGYGLQDKSPLPIFELVTFPDLPPSDRQKTQLGLAGAFSGASHGVIIVAGGANFPNGMPWDGGNKEWYDEVYVFNNGKWHVDRRFTLPTGLAYGSSIQLDEGVLCVGGDDGKQKSKQVFLLSWDEEAQRIIKEDYPPLPVPLAYMSGDVVGSTVYITGGISDHSSTKHFFALNLSKKACPISNGRH